MYRDDTCAVCGESLPPDHFYCREHGATVDDRLHTLGALLPEIATQLGRAGDLLDGVAEETWDYLAEGHPDEPEWPPVAVMRVRALPDEVAVDIDSEPGFVRVELRLDVGQLIAAAAAAVAAAPVQAAAMAARDAEGANATH